MLKLKGPRKGGANMTVPLPIDVPLGFSLVETTDDLDRRFEAEVGGPTEPGDDGGSSTLCLTVSPAEREVVGIDGLTDLLGGDLDEARRTAQAIGYPVLIKAAAGGGGGDNDDGSPSSP